MPLYEYICRNCGWKIEIFQHKARPRKVVTCKCGQRMVKIISQVNTDIVDRPRWSNAMGVSERQVPEARRLYPESTYNEKGQLLIRNRKHKLEEMKKRGMQELD